MKKKLIIMSRAFCVALPTLCQGKMLRIENGKEWEIDCGGVGYALWERLIEDLRTYALQNKQQEGKPKFLPQNNVTTRLKIGTTAEKMLSISVLRWSPGFAIYILQGGNI